MKDLRYKIQFYSPWHCSSGLSAGADMDMLVVKDQNGLPYIPGKTLKGLIREAVEDYAGLSGSINAEKVNEAFGLSADAEAPGKQDAAGKGTAFFSNVTLAPCEETAIVNGEAQHLMFSKVASTAIDENGVAKDHSLRSMETVVPCTLYAEITDLPDGVSKAIEKSIGLIHHIGLNRNRGLGRCDFIVEKGDEG